MGRKTKQALRKAKRNNPTSSTFLHEKDELSWYTGPSFLTQRPRDTKSLVVSIDGKEQLFVLGAEGALVRLPSTAELVANMNARRAKVSAKFREKQKFGKSKP
jgi:hypothetical protein